MNYIFLFTKFEYPPKADVLPICLMRSLLIAAIAFLFTSYSSFAQQTTYLVAGKVVDESTFMALPGVGILETMTGSGTVTDQKGEFKLGLKSFPVQLIFKHLGYFDDTLRISNYDQFRKYCEGIQIIITLRQNPFMIGEVVINPAGSAVPLFEKEPYSIMDYVIDGERFFALGYRNFNPLKPEIFLGNSAGRLLSVAKLNGASEVFRDCLGEIYAVAKDSAYLLKNTSDSLSLKPVCDISFFQKRVKPVVALKDPYYIYYEKSQGGQYHDYYLGNFNTNQQEIFYRVGDEKQELGFISTHQQLRQEFITEFSKSYFGGGELRAMHERQAKLLNKLNTDYRPVASALFQMEDSALLFDFKLQYINCIGTNSEFRWRTNIGIDLSKDFTGRIHRDKATNRFFLEFLNIQSTYLIEINPKTGQALAQIPIRQYRHIDHVNIDNNRIYFLYQADFGDKGKRLYYVNLSPL